MVTGPMKTIVILASLFCLNLFACIQDNPIQKVEVESKQKDNMKLKITIGTATFSAILQSNPTANTFKERLPLKIRMNELNNNEKYIDLPEDLPSNASNPGIIHDGDLMLYGSNTLVLFYKTFPTTYSYTKIAKITDTKGLEEALGSSKVDVTFEFD